MRENISGLDVFEERWKVALEAKYVVYEFSEQMVINLERTYAQSYICERICACVFDSVHHQTAVLTGRCELCN